MVIYHDLFSKAWEQRWVSSIESHFLPGREPGDDHDGTEWFLLGHHHIIGYIREHGWLHVETYKEGDRQNLFTSWKTFCILKVQPQDTKYNVNYKKRIHNGKLNWEHCTQWILLWNSWKLNNLGMTFNLTVKTLGHYFCLERSKKSSKVLNFNYQIQGKCLIQSWKHMEHVYYVNK